MTDDPERHHRRSIRLKGYDYAQAGAYFVTICAAERARVFGEIQDGEVRLSEIREAVAACWDAIPAHFPDVDLDGFVVMPNHVHGIVVLTAPTEPTEVTPTRADSTRANPTRATHASPLQGGTPRGPGARSVGAIVGSFKAAVSRQVNAQGGALGAVLWQRGYYEHVIRNERELDRIRAYIEANPARWAEDLENPDRRSL